MTNQDLKFTGGNFLYGIQKVYHDIMMKNELSDGKGAYKLSYAGDQSGPSFGGNQMDISTNADARKILSEIINAKDRLGNSFLTNQEKNRLNKLLSDQDMQNVNSIRSDLRGTPEKVFGNLAHKINDALRSDEGRKIIDKAYVSDINTRSNHIETVVSSIKQPTKFLDTVRPFSRLHQI